MSCPSLQGAGSGLNGDAPSREPDPSATASGKDADADLGRAAERGAAWVMAGQLGAQGLRLCSNLIITRLLPVQAFGLMLLVQVFVIGLEMLSDMGVRAAIIQSPRHDDQHFLDTAWTIQILRGGTLWACAAGAAVPFGLFYKQPALYVLLPVMGLAALLTGLQSTKHITQSRALNLGPIMRIELGSQLVAFVVTLGWALWSPTVWALVVGWLTRATCEALGSHFLLPGHHNRLAWNRAAVREIVTFGRWIVLSSSLTFLAREADVFIFGRLAELEQLGIYSRALVLVTVPQTIMARLNSRMLFPMYSRVVASGRSTPEVYRQVRKPFMILGGWAVSGLCGGAATVVALIYPESYADAGWMLHILLAGTWFGVVLESVNSSVLLAHGLPRWIALTGSAKLVGLAVLLPLGFWLGGFPGAIAGVALGEVVRYLVSMLAVRTVNLHALGQDARMLAMFCAGATAGWLGHRLGQHLALPTFVEAMLVAAATTGVWLPLIVPLIKQRLRGHNLFGL